MQNATRDMQKMGKDMTAVGKNMTMGITAPLMGIAALATKTFADFEQEMAKVAAISGATGEQMKALRKNAEDLGASTRYAASEVAGLQLNFSKLGLKPDEILDATEATLNLALATGEDLAESATVAASTVRGFGLAVSETKRVTDVMAASFSSSALDLNKFQTAMATVAPVANVAGQSIEDTTGMLSVLVNAGIDASTAGTGLRNIFLDIAQSGMTLEEAFEQINTSTNKNKTSMDLFGKRGATVATVLAANIEEAKKLTEAYNGSAGAAARMAGIMDDTLQGSFFKLKSAMESAFISLGETLAPAIRSAANFVADLVARFKDLSPATQKIIVVVGAFAAAIGPVLVALGFLMTTVIPGLIAALPMLGTAFTVLTGPIGLVAAAIAAIGYMVYKHWDRIKAEMVNLQNYFIDLYNESVVFRVAVEYIILTFKNLWSVVKLVFGSIYEIIKGAGSYVIDTFKNVGGVIKAALTGDFKAIPGIMKEQAQLAKQNFTDTFKDVGAEFSKFTDNVKNDFGNAIDAITKRKKISFVKENVDASAISEKVSEAVTAGMNPAGNITPVEPGRAKVSGISALKPVEITPLQQGPLDIIAEKMPAQVEAMSEQQMQFMANAIEFNEGLTGIIQNTAQNFAQGIGEIIGSMAAGNFSISDIGKLLLGTFGDMAIQIGKTAIGIGVAVKGIKAALQSLNPAVAIAAGAALIALGSLAKSALSKIGSGGGAKQIPAFANGAMLYGPTVGLMGEYAGAANNPEVVAPLDRLQKYIKDAVGEAGGTSKGEFKLRGQDLILLMDRAGQYKNRRG